MIVELLPATLLRRAIFEQHSVFCNGFDGFERYFRISAAVSGHIPHLDIDLSQSPQKVGTAGDYESVVENPGTRASVHVGDENFMLF